MNTFPESLPYVTATYSAAEKNAMARALALAAQGGAATRPNPRVGCVILDTVSGRVLAEGWHERYGGPHAEVNAVAALGPEADLSACTVLVTLEPCAHFGKTPPCADLLIRHGARDVVMAQLDPNPLVAGQGAARLAAAGARVRVGLLEADACWLNRRFLSRVERGRPWIVLKWAESADGYLSGPDGGPTPITAGATRRLVHRWRTEEAAILVGAGTALTDDPLLDTRHWPGPAPLRVVLTGERPLPPTLRLLTPAPGAAPALRWAGNDLPGLLAELQRQQIESMLVEGGARVLGSFLTAGLWDEIRVLRNPNLRLGGGVAAPTVPPDAVPHAHYTVGGDDVREFSRAAPAVG